MKRRIVKLCVLVLAGAIVNVAVAWAGCTRVVTKQRDLIEWSIGNRRKAKPFCDDALIIDTVSRAQSISNEIGNGLKIKASSRADRLRTWGRDITWITMQASARQLFANPGMTCRVIDAGWPFRCMRSSDWTWWVGHGCTSTRHLVPSRTFLCETIGSWRDGDITAAWTFPTGVRGCQFAINTVFYAALLWLLFAGPGFIRHRIRARRGLCTACAYPIGTNPVCTECGTPVTPRRSDGM